MSCMLIIFVQYFNIHRFEHFSTSNVKIKTYHKLKIFLRRIRFSFFPHIITSSFCKMEPSDGYFEKLCIPRPLQGNFRSINTTTSEVSSKHQWKKFSFLSVSLTLFNLEIWKKSNLSYIINHQYKSPFLRIRQFIVY